jgi:DedD protein
MGLKSFFSRRQAQDTPPPAPRSRPRATQGDADVVQQARIRARQRLTGAAVLLGIGIIGFPLLFETQPRPIPVDIPITIPNRDSAAPLAPPPAASGATGAVHAAAAPPAVIEETAADAGRELAAPPASSPTGGTGPAEGNAPTAATTPKPAEKPAATTAADQPAARKPAAPDQGRKDAEAPQPAPPAHKTAATAASDDAARAKALLDGKAASEAAVAGRFVVQVGAFADAGSARQARMRVEKLGLKTYTQAVDTSGGRRIRVRVGPFTSRDDANAAAAKLHAAGLPSAVLTL